MKNKYICPYCGALAEFAQPFVRIVPFLFWHLEIPAPAWYAACSEYCEDFLASPERTRGRTLAECKRNWHRTFGLSGMRMPHYQPPTLRIGDQLNGK